MGDLISVIVPIYNSDQYISGCVESVLAQTYRHFELLLVDDGSEDRSRDICAGLSAADKRIQVILQKHQGVSAARNAGMRASKGKYLFFLDADDIIHPQLLEALYRLLEEKGAAVASESRYYAPGGDFKKPGEWDIETDSILAGTYLDCTEAIKALIYGDREATLYVIGGKMICREAVGQVQFEEGLSHGEDTLFLYRLLEEGADVAVLCRNWYYYRMYEGSATSIFTVPACRSRYKAEQYIRNREIRSGRIDYAVHWEEAMARAMMAWYEAGRGRQDGGLINYVRELAEHEMHLKIFSKISKLEKIKLYLLLHCHPLYQPFLVLCALMLRCSGICRRLSGNLHRRR